jgi:accessory gene regulator protein AgrB
MKTLKHTLIALLIFGIVSYLTDDYIINSLGNLWGLLGYGIFFTIRKVSYYKARWDSLPD